MLKLPRRLVVIAIDEMDGLASQPIAICRHAIVLAETEISEEIKRVVGLYAGVQSIHNHPIHLPRICERAIAISNDVEVSKVKVGRKQSVGHDDDYAGIRLALFVRTTEFRVNGESYSLRVRIAVLSARRRLRQRDRQSPIRAVLQSSFRLVPEHVVSPSASQVRLFRHLRCKRPQLFGLVA